MYWCTCSHTWLQGKIKSLEQIYLFSMPVKEYQIVEAFLGPALKVTLQLTAPEPGSLLTICSYRSWQGTCPLPLLFRGSKSMLHVVD